MARPLAQVCWAVGSLLPALVLFEPGYAIAADGKAPQSSGAAQPLEIARARYRQGVEAYQAGHYRESIDYFLEADRVSPSAALSFNIALAYEKIDDPAAALRWYRDYLRRSPDAKDRASVESLVKAFEARLAAKGVQQVTVMSEPSAATVLVDGKPVGVTPWTMEIRPGQHRLEVRHDGFETIKQSIDVPADHATDIQLTLKAAEDAPAAPAAPPAPNLPASAPPPVTTTTKADEGTEGGGKTLTTLGIVGLAAGGAALIGAGTFELLRRGSESDAKKEPTQVGYADHVDTMESQQTVARVLLGTGVVLAATGGVLLFFGSKKSSENTTAFDVGCAPGGCVTTVRGRF
jgi:tetratricopeptide (TPR) repeat protein